MSGMYVNRVGLSGISIRDLPLIGKAVQWGDRKVQEAVETIVRRYAEFERAAIEAPAIAEDARFVLNTLRETGGTPQQMTQAVNYEAAAQKLVQDAANRGPVDQVVRWVEGIRRSGTGMGALPLIPVAIATAAGAAVLIINNTVKSYTESKTIRSLIQAGLTPDQIARIATRRSPFTAGLFGATSAVTVVALGIGALLLFNAFRKA